MLNETRVSTREVRCEERVSLVRDAAFNLFNLEVDLGDAPPASVAADIRVARGPVVSVIGVNTSWSIVERTRARASAASTGNFLVYLIQQGGSWFRNGRGEEFDTHAGSVVVGSQDAAYKAAAAKGQHWAFQAISVPPHLFRFAGDRIRHGGFQIVSAQAPLSGLVTSYVDHLCEDMRTLDGASAAASLRALDHLLATCLHGHDAREDGLDRTVAHERFRAGLRFMAANLESPRLSPAVIARQLCISPRQLHRAFEASDTTVTGEIRRLRLERAGELLRDCPGMPITAVAFSCGFDSLATFYRTFKAAFGITASEARGSLH